SHTPIEPPLRGLIAGGREMDRAEALVGVFLRKHGWCKRGRGRCDGHNGSKLDPIGHEILPGSPRRGQTFRTDYQGSLRPAIYPPVVTVELSLPARSARARLSQESRA